MLDEAKKYLTDIFKSIQSIEEYLTGKKEFETYQKNKVIKRAVERELEIIGEAMNKLLKADSEIKIENAKKIVQLRNFIIHAYDSVDDAIIWSIVINHLPKLKNEVQILLTK